MLTAHRRNVKLTDMFSSYLITVAGRVFGVGIYTDDVTNGSCVK